MKEEKISGLEFSKTALRVLNDHETLLIAGGDVVTPEPGYTSDCQYTGDGGGDTGGGTGGGTCGPGDGGNTIQSRAGCGPTNTCAPPTLTLAKK